MSGVSITLRHDGDMDESMDDQRPRVVITTKSGTAAQSAAGGIDVSVSSTGRKQIRTKGRGFKGQFGQDQNQDRYAGKVRRNNTSTHQQPSPHTHAHARDAVNKDGIFMLSGTCVLCMCFVCRVASLRASKRPKVAMTHRSVRTHTHTPRASLLGGW